MRILFVCAGNLFRSVMSESLFRMRAGSLLLGPGAPLAVESSGLEAEPGSGPHPDCIYALKRLGAPVDLSPPVRTDEEQMSRADLAVAMTRQQSYIMAGRFPDHREKCFSLIELNGAAWTLLGEPAVESAAAGQGASAGCTGRGLERASAALRKTPRECMKPLEGVPIGIRDLMVHFAPCFHQVSGIHDPVGGGRREIVMCAEQIDREVSRLLDNLLSLSARLGAADRPTPVSLPPCSP